MEKMPVATSVHPLDVLGCVEIARWLWDVPSSMGCACTVHKVTWLRSALVHH